MSTLTSPISEPSSSLNSSLSNIFTTTVDDKLTSLGSDDQWSEKKKSNAAKEMDAHR
jgi:hypothetical protein